MKTVDFNFYSVRVLSNETLALIKLLNTLSLTLSMHSTQPSNSSIFFKTSLTSSSFIFLKLHNLSSVHWSSSIGSSTFAFFDSLSRPLQDDLLAANDNAKLSKSASDTEAVALTTPDIAAASSASGTRE